MDSVKVNGVELEYEVRGSGEPVLLIDMLIADCFVPILTEPSLAGRYQLIRYHKRGWVGSTHTPPPVSMGDHAADAAALLDHLGVGRAHIAGHSTGASIAAQLALDHPEKVHTLTLLEPTLVSLPLGQEFLKSAGPVFEAYRKRRPLGCVRDVRGRRERPRLGTCRALLEERIPGVVAQSIKDADTFFGIELPRLPTGPSAPSKRPLSTAGPVRAGCRDPASMGRDRRVPPLVTPVHRGMHDRRRGSSPADPATRARRSSDGGVPGAKPCRRLRAHPTLHAGRSRENPCALHEERSKASHRDLWTGSWRGPRACRPRVRSDTPTHEPGDAPQTLSPWDRGAHLWACAGAGGSQLDLVEQAERRQLCAAAHPIPAAANLRLTAGPPMRFGHGLRDKRD